jgi:hypothetical protein
VKFSQKSLNFHLISSSLLPSRSSLLRGSLNKSITQNEKKGISKTPIPKKATNHQVTKIQQLNKKSKPMQNQ